MGQSLMIRSLLAIFFAFILTACGGGGGGNNEPAPITTSASAAITSSAASSISSTSADTSSVPATGITFITIYYKRPAEDYTGWGLHLWNTEGGVAALAASTETTWSAPRPFDEIISGWNKAVIPIINATATVNFIVHKGDAKSPTADLAFIPAVQGDQVWVVQDNNTLFFSETEANIAVASVGNASSILDLSDVAPMSVASELPQDWNRSANFMEIFVRSYQDSNGDGRGDLQGLISRLDYLQNLGITGIWLMPVMESSDNDHGYSVIDYRKIETDYGTMADFETLLTEAHARGIGVIIDYVMNHSSSANPLFLDATASANNAKRDWYIFSSTNLGWTSWGSQPSWHTGATGFYYGVFTSGLPDFNLRNPDVIDYHMDNLRFWLNKGVDGFRFDATGVLIENGSNAWSDQADNHPLLAQAQDVVDSYDNRFMICEAPDAPSQYALPSSCINSFAFGYQSDVKNAAKNRSLPAHLVGLLSSSTKATMPLFLSNHDGFAGGRPVGELSNNNLGDYKVAAAISILTSSTPFTYYGEEIGMANGNLSGDPALRTPMSWTANTSNAGFSSVLPYRALSANVANFNVAAQEGMAGSLLEHYRALYHVRKQNSVLGSGTLSLKSSSGSSHLIFTRTNGSNLAVVVINLSLIAQTLSVNAGVTSASFMQKLPETNMVYTSDSSGMISINVPAQSAVVLIK